MSTVDLPSSWTALPAAPAVQVAPFRVPSAALAEASRAAVPVPSSKCHDPLAASAATADAVSGVGYARTSSTPPANQSAGLPAHLPRPTTRWPIAVHGEVNGTLCCRVPLTYRESVPATRL